MVKNDDVNFKLLNQKVDYIKEKVDKIEERMEQDYATKTELTYTNERIAKLERTIWFVASALFLAMMGLVFSGFRISFLP
jgi:tetrahydromethanopterin S-methyltransferase subunit G